MRPEQRIRYCLQGVANRLNRRLDAIDERTRYTGPTTTEDAEREERRRMTDWREAAMVVVSGAAAMA